MVEELGLYLVSVLLLFSSFFCFLMDSEHETSMCCHVFFHIFCLCSKKAQLGALKNAPLGLTKELPLSWIPDITHEEPAIAERLDHGSSRSIICKPLADMLGS